MISQPPHQTLEQAWKELLLPAAVSAGILPANVFLSDTSAGVLHPCLKITTNRIEEVVTPGSGVFKANSSLKYETKLSADQQSSAGANAAFEQIFQALYYGGDPTQQTLAARMTAALNGQFFCYGVVQRQMTNAVQSFDKLWVKEILLDVWFINRTNP